MAVGEDPGPRVVITGANGAVGTALIRHLSQHAPTTRLRALVRQRTGTTAWQDGGIESRVIDYGQPETLLAALAGAEVVVHLAGALVPRRGETLQQANVATTRALVEAALANDVNTFVYLSFPGADATAQNQYLRTKGLAEVSITQAGFAGAIFRVPLILGPGSPSMLQLQRLAQAPWVPLIGGGTVRIQPIAQADILAAITWAMLTAPRPLRLLDLVGPETLTYAALLRQVCQRLGSHPRFLAVPQAVAWLSACLAGTLLPTLGWNRSVFDILFYEHLADPAEACTALGLKLTPLAATLDAALSTRH